LIISITSPHTFVDEKVDWICYEPMAECEFVFTFKKDLPARDEPYSREEIIDAISHAQAAVELVANRIENIENNGGIYTKVADCGSHYALIVNDKQKITENFDQFWNKEIVLRLNDDIVTKALGNYVYNGRADPSDHTGPLDTTIWAVNELTSKFGVGIHAGHVISSGTCTGKTDPLEKDDELVADFNEFGKIEVKFK
jgi:2-keto-4-pentenoate hydratase